MLITFATSHIPQEVNSGHLFERFFNRPCFVGDLVPFVDRDVVKPITAQNRLVMLSDDSLYFYAPDIADICFKRLVAALRAVTEMTQTTDTFFPHRLAPFLLL